MKAKAGRETNPTTTATDVAERLKIMKKIIITDPRNLLDNNEWADCCKMLQPENDSVFCDAIHKKLEQKDFIKQVIDVELIPHNAHCLHIQTGFNCRLLNLSNFLKLPSSVFCVLEIDDFSKNPKIEELAQLECKTQSDIVLKDYKFFDEYAPYGVRRGEDLFDLVWCFFEDEDEEEDEED